MKERRVRFTATARKHVDRERTWWLENRDYKELFANELESAVRVLSILPGAGSPYTRAGIPDLRRLFIRKLTCHLYYTFDDDEVLVRALWGARHERGPALP